MKEVSRIVVGLIALRVTQNDNNYSCEMFKSSKWEKITPTKLHQLAFDERICDWLNQHYHSRLEMTIKEEASVSESIDKQS